MVVILSINLRPLFDREKINPLTFSKKAKVTYHAIHDIYTGKTSRISLDMLEKLCKILHCTPNDLFESDDPELKERMEEYQRIILKSKERPE